ncbi:hypothetical protein [Mycoplasma struthionis]|nr:hypothetical protein [Mycoplasma struthionis]
MLSASIIEDIFWAIIIVAKGEFANFSFILCLTKASVLASKAEVESSKN